MGDVIRSFFSGLGKAFGNLFGHPLDFIAGKSCSSVCGSTWDFTCYIENFCVANLLKMAMVFVLLYIVLLFFYVLYKLGICECISRSLCRMVWSCCASCIYSWECCCTFLCVKLRFHKRRRRRRRRRRKIDIEVLDTSSEEEKEEDDEENQIVPFHVPNKQIEKRSCSSSRLQRDYRSAHLRKSLRPRNHHIRAGIVSRDLAFGNRRIDSIGNGYDDANIRVTRTSKFVRKGTNYKERAHQRGRR